MNFPKQGALGQLLGDKTSIQCYGGVIRLLVTICLVLITTRKVFLHGA